MTITDDMVRDATIEYLSHRGELPRRILRGGAELWETHAGAMRSALTAAMRQAPSLTSHKDTAS